MVEYVGEKEKLVNVDEPIIFENKTGSNYEVSAGIVFHKGGVYEVSIEGCKTTISKISERKQGWWIDTGSGQQCSVCKEIQYGYDNHRYFCANCGADMRGDCANGY